MVGASICGPGEAEKAAASVEAALDHLLPFAKASAKNREIIAGGAARAALSPWVVVESEHLSSFEVRAAFDGTVIDKHISPGEAVDRDEPAFIIADLSTVWVTISVYQQALDAVRIGRPVVIEASHGNLEATGRVAYISPVVDQATRTASARRAAQSRRRVAAGRVRHGHDLQPGRRRRRRPRRAVQTMDGRSVVFVADGDRLAAREVVLGRTGRTKVEIVSGLAPGDRFADERSFLVKAELAKGAAEHHH